MLNPQTLWINIRSSLWFVPSLLIVAALSAALVLLRLDASFAWKEEWSWLWKLGLNADGARIILSTIAASMISIAGVSFSITVVALSLAANSYTPRVLRNFMRDQGNQWVLGGFVSIFVFCLAVLGKVHGGDTPSVPTLSLLGAFAMALLGIGLFIFFIHHVATTIQVSSVLQSVSRETIESLDRMFPDEIGEEEETEGNDAEQAKLRAGEGKEILAEQSGYLQGVDADGLMDLAEASNAVFRLELRVGDFLIRDKPLVTVLGGEAPSPEKINRLFGVSGFRTIEQDPGFGIRQIVDIALKALSPGINDPTTATECLDHLGHILHVLCKRRIPSPFRYRDGKLRVVARGPTFSGMVELMFLEIRGNARGNLFVLRRILECIGQAIPPHPSDSRRRILLEAVHLCAEHAEAQLKFESERREFERCAREVMVRLSEGKGRPDGGRAAVQG